MVKVPATAPRQVRALLVDDDPDVRAVTREALELLGILVVEAPNGLEALMRFKEGGWCPDVAVLDFNMPVMNGIETLRAIRSYRPGLKAVLCSGSGGEELRSQCGREAVEFLPKPFRLSELESAIQRAFHAAPEDGTVKPRGGRVCI